MPRFQSLVPNLLRNYLMDETLRYAVLNLAAIPASEIQRSMMNLLKKAFDWVLVISPQGDLPEDLALLDTCDLLLWVVSPESPTKVLQKKLDGLTAAHFPHAFSQFVLNRVSSPRSKVNDIQDILPGHKILARLPEDRDHGLRLQEAVRDLARTLVVREDLWAVKSKTPVTDASANQVIQELKNRVQPELLKVLDPKESRTGVNSQATVELAQKTVEACLAENATLSVSREERSQIMNRVLDEVLGLGPLEPLLIHDGSS